MKFRPRLDPASIGRKLCAPPLIPEHLLDLECPEETAEEVARELRHLDRRVPMHVWTGEKPATEDRAWERVAGWLVPPTGDYCPTFEPPFVGSDGRRGPGYVVHVQEQTQRVKASARTAVSEELRRWL